MKIKSLLMPVLLSFCLCSTSCVAPRPGHKPPHKEVPPPGHDPHKHKPKPDKPKPHKPGPPDPGKDRPPHP